MRRITREQGRTMETRDMIGPQHYGYIEGQKMSGDTAEAPAFPLDIIWRPLGLLFFQVKAEFVKDIAESRYNIPVSINVRTRAFDCPRCCVQAASRTGRTSRDNAECISPSTKIARNKSLTGFNSTQNKTH
jgi:hypothetical protein